MITFLLAGLKYHDETVASNNTNDGAAAVKACPTIKCETKAPDITKKKPA